MCCLFVLAWFRPLIWTLCLRSGAQPLWDSVASRVRQRFTWRKTEVYQSEYTLQTVNGIPVSSLVYLFVSTLLVGHRVWSENKLYVNIGTKGLLSADLRPLRIFGPGNLPVYPYNEVARINYGGLRKSSPFSSLSQHQVIHILVLPNCIKCYGLWNSLTSHWVLKCFGSNLPSCKMAIICWFWTGNGLMLAACWVLSQYEVCLSQVWGFPC